MLAARLRLTEKLSRFDRPGVPSMSLADTRFDQLFPVFNRSQIETAKRFASGPARRFAPAELIYDVGQRNVPSWLVLEGNVEIERRDGLHHQSTVVSLGAGQFTGEVSQLGGRGTLGRRPGGSRRLHRAAVRCRAYSRAGDRIGRRRRNRHACVYPAPRGVSPGRRHRLAADRLQLARSHPPAKAFSRAMPIPTRRSTPPPTRRRVR